MPFAFASKRKDKRENCTDFYLLALLSGMIPFRHCLSAEILLSFCSSL
jgi:hypothetical protein